MTKEEFFDKLNKELDLLDGEDLKIEDFRLSVNIKCQGKYFSSPPKSIDIGFYFDGYFGKGICRAPGPYDSRNNDSDDE